MILKIIIILMLVLIVCIFLYMLYVHSTLIKFNSSQNLVETENVSYYDGEKCFCEMINKFGIKAVINFCEINSFKYMYRAGKKSTDTYSTDVKKAQWYSNKAYILKQKLIQQKTSNEITKIVKNTKHNVKLGDGKKYLGNRKGNSNVRTSNNK